MFCTYEIIKQCKYSNRFISNYSANVLLNAENRENCMRKFQAMSLKQAAKPTTKNAAVLIPIYVDGDEVSLLYTLRAASLKTHRGQVSFPGGMTDATDHSTEATALRETQEELGVNPEDVDIWGCGNPIIRHDMTILPVVGCLKHNLALDKLQLNCGEVEKVFTMKLEQLCDPKLNRHTQFRGTFSAPVYFGGPYRIWGLTAVMTFMFLKSFLPPNTYTHQVKYIPNVVKLLKS